MACLLPASSFAVIYCGDLFLWVDIDKELLLAYLYDFKKFSHHSDELIICLLTFVHDKHFLL